MSITIINELPAEYELLHTFNKFCKLYKKNDLSYVCGVIVHWHDDVEKYFEILMNENTLEKTLTMPDGFTVEEYRAVGKIVLDNCVTINHHLFDEDAALHDFYASFLIEHICFVFFSNTIFLHFNKNELMIWNDENKLFYCLAQLLLTAYSVIFFEKRGVVI